VGTTRDDRRLALREDHPQPDDKSSAIRCARSLRQIKHRGFGVWATLIYWPGFPHRNGFVRDVAWRGAAIRDLDGGGLVRDLIPARPEGAKESGGIAAALSPGSRAYRALWRQPHLPVPG
jgi:hypothetical protein